MQKAAQKDTKIKITYQNPDFSAFLVENLVRGLNLSQNVQIKRAAAPSDDLRASVTNVKLVIGETTIYGELSIGDYLVAEANRVHGTKHQRLTQELVFDHWAFFLNNHLREAAHEYLVQKNNDKKELLKRLIKEVDDKLYPLLFPKTAQKPYGDFGLLHAMYYSFLEPVKIMTNNVVKGLLPKFRDTHNLLTFDQFKGGEEAGGETKKITKGVAVSQSHAKIHRIPKKQAILPKEGERNVLITSALPYVNNVPHLGNIIGCVLSADVFARYSRLMGYNTLYVCGTDEYGTATETKALEEGKTPKEICDHYFGIHKKIYEWFDCDFDHFGRTTTEWQTKITQDIFTKNVKHGNTYEEVVDQQFCLKCNRFLADRLVFGECYLCHFPDAKGDQCDGCGKLLNANELINPRCKVCKTTPEVRQSKHIFIDLPKIQPVHLHWFEDAAEKGKWTQNSIQFTHALLKEGLKGRCITRDLKWGTPIPLEEYKDKVFYVWFDAPIGYLSITAGYAGEDWEKWWKNNDKVQLYQFMGKDNITFHSVIFPCTLLGSQDPYTMLHHISTTEFLNYELDEKTGKPKKFSKSRSTGVFGDDAMNTGIPSEVWRYYLLINRPEQQDTVFLWNDFLAKNNSELLANLGNFSNRLLKFVAGAHYGGKVPASDAPSAEDQKFIDSLYEKYEEYHELMEHVKIKEGLKVCMTFSSLCNVYIQDNKPWDLAKTNPARCAQVVRAGLNALRLLCAMLEPFIPSFSAKVYEQMNLLNKDGQRISERDETLLAFIKGHPERINELVPTGHQIGEPQPIFREIQPAEVEKWKAAYGGNGHE